MTHAAFNLRTGELFTCSTSNGLRRRVAQTNHHSRKYDLPTGPWVFAHGRKWGAILGEKIAARADLTSHLA